MTSRQWTMLEVEVQVALLNAISPEHARRIDRRASKIRRRWRNREMVEFGVVDLGGEA